MQEKHNPNGFMFGLIIGAAVGALVSTKKGREILKDVADYGLEYVGNIINLDDLESAFEDDGEEMSAAADEIRDTADDVVEKGKAQAKETMGAADEATKPLRRRLFRGIRKK